MNTAGFNQIAFNSYPDAGKKTLTVSVGAWIVTVSTKTLAVGAYLRGTYAVSCEVGALLQGAGTKFVSVGAYLAVPYHDNGAWQQEVGNGLTAPIDPNRAASWSTYSRPGSPVDGQSGRNVQTGKVETWDEKNAAWKDSAGNVL